MIQGLSSQYFYAELGKNNYSYFKHNIVNYFKVRGICSWQAISLNYGAIYSHSEFFQEGNHGRRNIVR